MNQIEIGKFISESRKAKALTQKQLADQIGVTDKTVSKWETGMRLPDAGILIDLCRTLEIDINELLAGEVLQGDEYAEKAESNIVELVGEINAVTNESKGRRMGTIVGIVFIVLALVMIMVNAVGVSGLQNFIDLPTIFTLLGLSFLIIAFIGYFHDFRNAFVLCFIKKSKTDKEIKASVEAMKFSCLVTLASGMLLSIIGGISALGCIDNIAFIGPALARMILSIFYTLLLEIIYLSILFRIKQFCLL